jgi:glycosyltransferase involved in cell wall biosynthesis
LKIAVNTRLLLKNKIEGIGWFKYENLSRITRQHPEHQFYFLFDRPYSEEFIFADNVTPLVVNPQARHPVLYYLWFEHAIPRSLKKIDADLFLSPDGYLSLSSKVPSMNVFHDLSFEHFPEDLPYFERKYYRHFFPKYAKKAIRIATVSEHSKQDIVKQYGVDENKIDLVYSGTNDSFKSVGEDVKKRIKDEFTGGAPYFLFMGSLHPRKNLARLFTAFDQFKQTDSSNTKLLIVGMKKWWTGNIKEAFDGMKHQDDVILPGRVELQTLNEIVASALAVTYVSYLEGFGLPILEGFHSDTPVITSNITSMPEVAGDAALLVDPFSTDSIAVAMTRIATDSNLRDELIKKGRLQKEKFSWQKTSELLWGSIEKTMEEIGKRV